MTNREAAYVTLREIMSDQESGDDNRIKAAATLLNDIQIQENLKAYESQADPR